MKKIFLLMLTVSVFGCTTTPKANKSSQNLTDSPHKEKTLESVDKIYYPSPMEATAFSEESYECSQEDALFLMSAPHEVISASKALYESVMRTNQNAQEYASKYFAYQKGETSSEDFITYQMLSTQRLASDTKEHQHLLSMFIVSYQMQERISNTYHICSATIEKVLLSKKVDPKKKGCELEQHKVIVFDPFDMKRNLMDGIKLESHIQQHLFEVNELITSHVNKTITDSELTEKVNAVYEHILSENLPQQSSTMAKAIRYSLDRSYSVKEQCLQRK